MIASEIMPVDKDLPRYDVYFDIGHNIATDYLMALKNSQTWSVQIFIFWLWESLKVMWKKLQSRLKGLLKLGKWIQQIKVLLKMTSL